MLGIWQQALRFLFAPSPLLVIAVVSWILLSLSSALACQLSAGLFMRVLVKPHFAPS